ncbi:MAG: hypothetical protein AAF614_07635 [Chloroflexota bacterium]
MDDLIFIIAPLIVLVSVGVVFYLFFGTRKTLPIEEGETPIFSAAMGGKIGWVRYRGPILRVRLYGSFLVIARLGNPIVLHFDEIEEIEVAKWLGLIDNGVQIHHHNHDAPQTIVLSSLQSDKLHKLLKERLR